MAQTATVTGKIVDSRNRGIQDALVSIKDLPALRTRTNLDGEFSLNVPAEKAVELNIVYATEKIEVPLFLVEGEQRKLERIKLNVQNIEGVDISGKRQNKVGQLPKIEIQNIPGPQTSVERYLTLTTAATSNNELTNNYNVRGGSYDENLVYVNGFQIYRPFLTRTGQQEGMSFINPNLVEDIFFSAGGFEARFGDRLSSVLDIIYREPEELRGSADISLLGAGVHIEDKVNARFNYLFGARYQDQSYLLNSLPVQGAYQPRFYDAQFLTNYNITENLKWSVLGHFSSNDFIFAPESQETKFGTINQSLSFRVFFEGQEVTRFRTLTGATSFKWDASRRLNLDFYASAFNSDERETFDILGQYFINELETDPSKEEFGDSVGTLGVGSFLDHARNRLFANIYQTRHEGTYRFLKLTDDGLDYINQGTLQWGVSAQYEDFDDVMSEWSYVDSAGYSVPQQPADEIQLFEVIHAHNRLQSFRTDGFLQFNKNWEKTTDVLPVSLKHTARDENGNKIKEVVQDTIYGAKQKWDWHVGARAGYTAFNNDFFFTPRTGISFYPARYYVNPEGKIKKRLLRLHASTGMYYQPPFYREIRELNGPMNLDVLSQKSLHAVVGMDYGFEMWGRKKPFKLAGEVYYKHLWDVNPYQIDNVRTRYLAMNDAVGYAYGLDMNLHGEFIDGIESFFKIGLMQTRENLFEDDFYIYYNDEGNRIFPGFTLNDTPADSVLTSPGFIPRPTDQWLTFATLFQDRMPGFEQLTVQLGFHYGSRLPYGPPDGKRYTDTLRQRQYMRVDIGFGYDFLHGKAAKKDRNSWLKHLDDFRLNIEVFNLFGINNVLSQQWVRDTQGRYYAIPNFLTFRRINLKLIVRW